MSYGMISTLVISRYAAPPFPLRGTSPLCRGQNKTLRDNLLINPPLEMTVAAGAAVVQKGCIPQGKRLTMICASLALLQIMFAVHPRESVSHDSQVALLPYESCSLATPSGGQNKSLYAFLQRHGSIAKHP